MAKKITIVLFLSLLLGCSDKRSFDSNDSNDSNDLILWDTPCFEDRDANHSLLAFTVDGKSVILDADANGCLYMELVDCNEAEAARVVWGAVNVLTQQLNYTADYMKRLVDAM